MMVAHGLLLPIVAKHPDAAGVIVAVDVGPDELLELLAMIDEPTGDGPEVGVVVFGGRHQEGGRPARTLGPERVAPFEHAPAVIAAAFHQVNLLPQILADIADPEITRGAIEAH